MSKQSQRRAAAKQRDAMEYRSLAVRSSSINEENRTVEATITTEAPTPMWDWTRREMVPETMLMSGMSSPAQVPFLNAHNRGSIEAQLGSVRNIRTDGPDAIATLAFSTTAGDAFTKVREGHVTDVSVGYQVTEKTFVPRGEKAVIAGREFNGPMNVVTGWKLKEVSLVPIGADELAKLRGFDPQLPEESFKMDETLRQLCVKAGMAAELDDAAAQKWMAENLFKVKAPEPTPISAPDVSATVKAAIKEYEAQRQARETAHRAECDSLAAIAQRGDLLPLLYATEPSKVREVLQAELVKGRSDIPGSPIPFSGGAAQKDKHFAETRATLLTRCVRSAAPTAAAQVKYLEADLAKVADNSHLRDMSLMELAEQCLHIDGIPTRGLTREQKAIAALGWPSVVGVRAAYDPAYHVTGSFPKLTQDAINKSMMIGYGETPVTWRSCFRQGDSVPDFKTIHRMRIGALPNLPDWPDNTDVAQASLADAEETYKVEPKSLKISFSYRLLVNDDMSMLTRVPAMFGDAAARTVNALAWAQITSNPTMGDSVALFSAATGARKRSNLTTGAGAPSVSTIQTLRNLMRQMRGENTPEAAESADILNLEPAFIVGPTALETTIWQLCMSTYDPAAAAIMVANPARQLQMVIEPLLDAASTTAWYLFASPSRIDTVEVTFLQGHETPVTRNWQDPETLSQNFAVLQACAAKALQHRGLQKHAGA